METVVAVVVTYNRNEDLKKCLFSLQRQTRAPDEIIVVNNGSTDETGSWLAQQAGFTVITQSNLGGAGGFATGINQGYKAGHDWIWCMDDDCLPAADALEQLLASPILGPSIKNSISVNNQDHTDLTFHVDQPNRSYRRVQDMSQFDMVYGVAAFFNGTLIHSAVVKHIGVPDEKLFIWGDEVEYMTRAIKMGYAIVTIPSSVIYHPPSFDRQGIPWPGAWKQYYAVRNQRRIFQNIYGNKYGLIMFMHWSIKATIAQVILSRKNWFYNLLLYSEASFDSLLNNFNKKPHQILTLHVYGLLNKQARKSPGPA